MAAVAERPLPGGAGTGSTTTLGAGSTPNLETPTRIPEAADLVLRGRRELASGTPVGTARAVEIFTQAIELAPDYPPAHLSLADAQIELGMTGARPLAVVLPQVRAHLDDALRGSTQTSHRPTPPWRRSSAPSSGIGRGRRGSSRRRWSWLPRQRCIEPLLSFSRLEGATMTPSGRSPWHSVRSPAPPPTLRRRA